MVPKSSTPSKDKPAEEEPPVSNNPVQITQDDVNFNTKNVEDTEDDTAIEAIIKANPTTFCEFVDEDYAKSVSNQHFLANPHLPNPNTTKAEHVAKLTEVREQEAATGTTTPAKVTAKLLNKVKLPPASDKPVPKPMTVDTLDPIIIDTETLALNALKGKLDAWTFNYHSPTVTIETAGKVCPIAEELTSPSIEVQEKNCKEFFEFISQHSTDVGILNTETTPYTFLVHIPGTRRLKVCYGMGSGVSFGGLKGSTINDKALALSGDYQAGVRYPTVLTFPIDSIVSPLKVKTPTYNDLFNINRTYGANKPPDTRVTFFKSGDLVEMVKLHHIAPIPAFLIKDHIDKSIDALVIIDRLQCIQQLNPNYTTTKCRLVYRHALNYCMNVLVNRTKKEITNTFSLQHFMGDNDEDAHTWKQQRLQQQFPTIFDTNQGVRTPEITQPNPATKPAATPQKSEAKPSIEDPKDDETTRLLKLYLTTQLQQQQAGPKEEAPDKFLGLSESECNMLLNYCGINDGNMNDLPKLWHELAEKNRSKEGKKNNVRSALRNTKVMYKDAKIKVTPTLLTMITSRAFEGETSSSKQEATKGLSPFILPPISNLELDEIIALDTVIMEATNITTSDIKKTRITLVEVDDYEGMMRYLKEFANLLEVLFSQKCPLWRAIHDVIEKLMDYTAEERAALNRVSCNAILWIVMRQSRAFAAGDMPEPESASMEFTEMVLRIHIRGQIEFGGLPATMKRKADSNEINNNIKRTNNNTNNNNNNNNNSTRSNNSTSNNNNSYNNNNNNQYNTNNNHIEFTDKGCQNPKLATAFRRIKTQNRTPPQVYRITTYCNTHYGDLFRKKGMCTKAQLFGLCDKDCPHVHERISDGEADSVIRKLKRAIDNPNEFKNRV